MILLYVCDMRSPDTEIHDLAIKANTERRRRCKHGEKSKRIDLSALVENMSQQNIFRRWLHTQRVLASSWVIHFPPRAADANPPQRATSKWKAQIPQQDCVSRSIRWRCVGGFCPDAYLWTASEAPTNRRRVAAGSRAHLQDEIPVGSS
jgi:hypothetical protein